MEAADTVLLMDVFAAWVFLLSASSQNQCESRKRLELYPLRLLEYALHVVELLPSQIVDALQRGCLTLMHW